MRTVYEHESQLQSNSVSTYLINAIFFLVIGLGVLVYNINQSLANFEYVLNFACVSFIVLIPLTTMKSISEERKQHTDKLLYSLPLSMSDIVIGKYLVLVTNLLWPIVVIAIYPLVFRIYGDVYLPTAYGSLFAFFLMGAAFISLGVFISSLTDSQGLAAGVTAAIIALDYFIVNLSEYVSGSVWGSIIFLEIVFLAVFFIVKSMTKNVKISLIIVGILELIMIILLLVNNSLLQELLPAIMAKISIYDRFSTFINGVFDVTSIIYYLSYTAFFLFLSVQAMEKRRYS